MKLKPVDGEWVKWDGRYEKQMYLVKTADGNIFQCWPNAGFMNIIDGDIQAAKKIRKFDSDADIEIWVSEPTVPDDLLEALKKANDKLKAIKEMFYGQNMEVAGWNYNDRTEPIDNFFNSNDWSPEEKTYKKYVKED